MFENFEVGDILNKYKYKYDFMKGLIEFIKKIVEVIKSIAASIGIELPTLKIG